MYEVAKYIFDWCPYLLTEAEKKARKHLIGLDKMESHESAARKNLSSKMWLYDDENVLKLLETGKEEFYKKTVERVLRENPNKDFLNLCPKCGTLTRTPKAKQCRKCYHSWHNKL
jgi:ribosomal protein L40E